MYEKQEVVAVVRLGGIDDARPAPRLQDALDLPPAKTT